MSELIGLIGTIIYKIGCIFMLIIILIICIFFIYFVVSAY